MPRTAFAARGICGFGLCGRAAWEPLHRFQSTRPCEARRAVCRSWDYQRNHFNPRAPCGARLPCRTHPPTPSNFNPHAPCGARRTPSLKTLPKTRFQSTRPVWGATARPRRRCTPTTNFNPRAPCGARRYTCRFDYNNNNGFQSTRPVWGATRTQPPLACRFLISIHAPRVGRDD